MKDTGEYCGVVSFGSDSNDDNAQYVMMPETASNPVKTVGKKLLWSCGCEFRKSLRWCGVRWQSVL